MKIVVRKFGSHWWATCDSCRRTAPRGTHFPREGRWYDSGAQAILAAVAHVDAHTEADPFLRWMRNTERNERAARRVEELEDENARLRRRLARREATT